MLLKKSTARNVPVLMIDSADHVAGKTGLTLTVTASKDGGAFGAIAPTVTELGSGWYTLALDAGMADTPGALALHVTAAGADPTDVLHEVVTGLPGEKVAVTVAAADVSGDLPAAVNALADGVITDAKFTAPAEAAGRPGGVLGMLRRAWEWGSNERTRDRSTGAVTLYGADGVTVLETQTQSTTGAVDQISQGA